MKRLNLKTSRGFTLIEMIIAIVVLAAAASGILFSIAQNIGTSADPMIQQQAIIIAQGYLEEVMLKPYSDPVDVETDSCEAGETRDKYDDVADYDCINDTAEALDQIGVGFGLTAYNVAVNVTTVNIGAPAVTSRRIDVIVTHDSDTSMNIVLTGYRTSYY